MGSSKSSRILKSLVGKGSKQDKDMKNKESSDESHTEEDVPSPRNAAKSKTEKSGKKKPRARAGKKNKKSAITPQSVTFTNKTISNLSRALGPNDWIKLAYALGFLPQGIAHIMGRASSSQNSYSQCTLMLKTWRDQTPEEEILPRICDALQRIRRHDLAVKVGLELSIKEPKKPAQQKKLPVLPPELLKLISENPDALPPSCEDNKMVLTDDGISFLARQILAREEWKRLAYALGFLPDDASQIIASASSSQNLYAQAHLMLKMWRSKTPAYELAPKLRAAFIRIRRHDLVFLLDLGSIIAPAQNDDETVEDRVKKLQMELKGKEGLGSELLSKFPQLQQISTN